MVIALAIELEAQGKGLIDMKEVKAWLFCWCAAIFFQYLLKGR